LMIPSVQVARGKGSKAIRSADIWKVWRSGGKPPQGSMKEPPAAPAEQDIGGVFQKAIGKHFAQQKGQKAQPGSRTAGEYADDGDPEPCIWRWSPTRRKQARQDWVRELDEIKKEQVEDGAQDVWDLMQRLEGVCCLPALI
jgi:hypothetical protein